MIDYLSGLNDRQKEAVLHIKGPLMIVAGAGSGKTKVVKTVINELNLDDKHYKPSTVYNRISSAKNSLVGPVEYANDYYLQQEDMRANRPAIAQIYSAYTARCFKNGAMDFDDLLFKM